MKIKHSLYILSKLTLLLVLFFLVSCEKSKDTKKEAQLKKEILAYQKLDEEQIKKVFHTSELEGLERSIKDKCKLQDLTVRSFYSLEEGKKFSFFAQKEIKLDVQCEYKDIASLIKFLKSKSKFIGIKELSIESQQTGLHNAKITIEVYVKNYLDRDFLPAAINAIAGLTVESEDYLVASLKVYKSRYSLVKRLVEIEAINWNSKLACLIKIPERSYVNKLQYLRTNQEEQLKLDVIAENNPENIKKVNSFFELSHDLNNELKTFSKRDKPEELPSGLVGLTFIYQK